MAALKDPAPTSSKGCVLIADDDLSIQTALSKLLTQQGYDCLVASDGAAALAMLHETEVDALISDIDMPGNVNLEFIGKISELRPGLPIFLLTGRPGFETAVKSVQLSVVAYLVKPLKICDLLPLLARQIDRFRRARAVLISRKRIESWAHELAVMEENLQKPSGGLDVSAHYVTTTIQNIALQLGGLARAMSVMPELSDSVKEMEKAELVSAMRQTILVLEGTRKNFKSKELADLRRQLSDLISETEQRRK